MMLKTRGEINHLIAQGTESAVTREPQPVPVGAGETAWEEAPGGAGHGWGAPF